MTEHDDKPKDQAPNPVSREAVQEYRALLTKGEDAIDPKTWAGSFPALYGIAPRLRVGANRWFNLLWLVPIGFVLLLVAVAAAKELRNDGRRPGAHSPPSRHRLRYSVHDGLAARGCASSTSSTCFS